jgi:hypothetical protein
MGKDERAISVSGCVYRGLVKYTDHAFNKITSYKRRSRNHLVDQIENFLVGDKDNTREDDLLDTFCCGIAIGLGNSEGFGQGRQANPRVPWGCQISRAASVRHR